MLRVPKMRQSRLAPVWTGPSSLSARAYCLSGEGAAKNYKSNMEMLSLLTDMATGLRTLWFVCLIIGYATVVTPQFGERGGNKRALMLLLYAILSTLICSHNPHARLTPAHHPKPRPLA